MWIEFKELVDGHAPKQPRAGDAGWDCYATQITRVRQGAIAKISLGFAMAFPPGYICKMYLRSSLGKAGFFMPNSVGIIDSSYRGEVCLLLSTVKSSPHMIESGEKVCQLVFQELAVPSSVKLVDELPGSERGEGGFGSTGVK